VTVRGLINDLLRFATNNILRNSMTALLEYLDLAALLNLVSDRNLLTNYSKYGHNYVHALWQNLLFNMQLKSD